MKKRSKIILTSLISIGIITSSTAFSLILSSCSNSSKQQQLDNTINESVSILNLGLQKQTKTQFHNLYSNDNQLLKNLVSKNLALLINGKITQIKDNFSCKLIYKDNEIYINLSINPGFWYKNDKLVSNESLVKDIHLTNFEKELTPSEGGTYNNLNIDTHLKLVDVLLTKLNINPLFNISTLTNDKLNNVYKNSTAYNQLNCSIMNGTNNKTGILILNLNGMYQGSNYKDVIVRITGFKNPSNLSKAFVSNIKLNLDQWFQNLQPTQTINKENILKINSQDFINKYIASAEISYIDSNHNISQFMSLNEALSNNYSIELQAPSIKPDGKTFTLLTNSINVQTKKYENNAWIDDELINITVNSQPNQASVNIPTNKESLQFLLDTTKINDAVLSEHYASYFKAQAMNAKSLNFSYPKIENLLQNNYLENIKNTYFPQNQYLNLNLTNNPNDFNVNDLESKLTFVVQVSIDDQPPTAFKQFNLDNKTKNLSNIIDQIKAIENNFILKSYEEGGSNWATRITKTIKKQYKQEIEALFVDQQIGKTNEIPVNLNSAALDIMNRFNYSNTGNWNENDANLKRIKENSIDDSFHVFNKRIIFDEANTPLINLTNNGDLNTPSGLFKYDNSNEFVINGINYQVEKIFQKLFVTYTGNAINFRLPFITSIELNGITIQQKSWISFIILKSQWEKLKT